MVAAKIIGVGWGGGPEQKNKFLGGPKILGGVYEPHLCHGRCVKRYSNMFVKF